MSKLMPNKALMMIFGKKAGINIRLLSASVLLIAGVSFTLGFIGVNITKGFMHTKFADRIRFLAKYLALNAEVGVLIGDRAGLKSLALNLLGEEDVARVIIFDNQNNRLVDLDREASGPLSVVEMPVVFKKSGDESILFEPSERSNDSSQTISRDFIGKVQITYSTHGIDLLMVKIKNLFIAAAAVLSLIAVSIFYLISRPIVSEMSNLASVARRIGQGYSLLRASPGKISETRDLAVAFNSMLDSLDRSKEALNSANRKMMNQRLLAEAGKFSLMIAHELKNPLGIIKSSLDLLKKDYEIAPDNIMASYIEDEIWRLNRLIEDFLMFARPVEPKFRDTDLNLMLKDICERFVLIYPDQMVTFNMNISDKAFNAEIDSDLLTRCITNILKNAYEAISDKGNIYIETDSKDGFWVLRIRDEGEGIPEDEFGKIFAPFFTTKSKGTGLGLSFVSQVVESHGGYVEASNHEKGGAMFEIRIPGYDVV